MITLFIVFYAFMAGMMAEWSHTRQKQLGFTDGIALAALGAALIWPYMLWRISR
ncbi:TPA: hypothetical protein N8F51_002435 [Escherichia coli]|nr:hypothetical protein [Escherichia coli]HCO3884075.1 hypothetical protein [Escherichia coli]